MKRLAYTIVVICLAFVSALAVATPANAGTKRAAKVFTKTWSGHTRTLRVGRHHVAHETIYDGCCDHVIDVKLRLSHFRGNRTSGSARAMVLSVHVFDAAAFSKNNPPPREGQHHRMLLRNGVLSEPFTRTNYCDMRAGRTGACGA
jgi:hypothetical protein